MPGPEPEFRRLTQEELNQLPMSLLQAMEYTAMVTLNDSVDAPDRGQEGWARKRYKLCVFLDQLRIAQKEPRTLFQRVCDDTLI